MDRDLDAEMKDGGRSWPVLGSAKAPFGTCELKAAVDIDAGCPSGGTLYVHVRFADAARHPLGGSGFAGVGLANRKRPLAISSSSRKAGPSVCYVGQVIFDADRVEAEFADSGTVEAAVLAGDLPVKLWVAFADVGNPLAAVRACRDRRELAAIPGVGEHRQRTHSSAVWGPIDE